MGFTAKIGSSFGEVMVVLGNNIKNIVLYVKQSPFNGKKDLVTGCLVGFSSSTKENQRALSMLWIALNVLMVIGHVGRG